jgi:uncharacterized RDD family membrane protein YckC
VERDSSQLTPPPIPPTDSDYWVRGEDDESYGPISLQELRDWALENRVGKGSWVRKGNGSWGLWESYSELETLLSENPVVLAPWGRRCGAFLIDYVILTLLISFVFLYVYGDLEVFQKEVHSVQEMMDRLKDPVYLELSLYMKLLMEFAHFVYFGYFLGRPQQTIGKKIMRLQVVDLQGNPIVKSRSWLRGIASVISIQFFWLGYWIAFLTPKRRALHDWLAQTQVVVRVPKD